jgi:hypothetical protein
MTIHYQFGDVDADAGATIRAPAAALEAEHQAIVRDVPAAGDFGAGSVSATSQGVDHPIGRQLPGAIRAGQWAPAKVQKTASNMAKRDGPGP